MKSNVFNFIKFIMKNNSLKKTKKRGRYSLLKENSLQRIFMVLLICIISIQYENAQTVKVITGTVSDASREVIIGASVKG
ncbi:hypothetical protein EZS27_029260 [termite gut metagenome]|uniref:TonB-dependent receptor SusC n=1 Tax=termite gut metagenome TaxID=433724 RepID=A0A5J4QJK4_9ZZZZ